MVLCEWYKEHEGRDNMPVALHMDAAKKKFESISRLLPSRRLAFLRELAKRDKFASFLGLSHRAGLRTDGKCQEVEGLYWKKWEVRSETKPGSFCSKQWPSPRAEGWRELGWEAHWAGSTQPGRWFIKATKKEKNSMQFSELTKSKYRVICAHPSKHQAALRRGRDHEYFSLSCVSQCLVES